MEGFIRRVDAHVTKTPTYCSDERHVPWCRCADTRPPNLGEPRGRIRLTRLQAMDLYAMLRTEHHRRYEELRQLSESEASPDVIAAARRDVRRVEHMRKSVLGVLRENGWQIPVR